jgi:hypothetical protein
MTGQPRQDIWDRKAGIRQSGQDSKERTTVTGQPRKKIGIGKPGQDSLDKTVWKGEGRHLEVGAHRGQHYNG